MRLGAREGPEEGLDVMGENVGETVVGLLNGEELGWMEGNTVIKHSMGGHSYEVTPSVQVVCVMG